MRPCSLSRRSVLAAGGTLLAAGSLPIATKSTPTTAEGNWPLGRGNPQNTGTTTQAGPTSTPEVAWHFTDHLSSRKAPVIADGSLYVGTFHETAAFVSLDAVTGDEQWRTDLGESMDVRFPDSAAAIAGDLVLAPFGRILFGFDRETGDVEWRRKYADEPSAPTVTNGTAYTTVVESGLVIAFDPTTGEPLWRNDVGGWCRYQVAVADNTVYVVTHKSDSGALVALDRETGEERWRYTSDRPLAGAPAVDNETIFVGDARGCHAVTTDGTRQWRFQGRPLDEHEWHNWSHEASSPAVDDDTVYIGTSDERVYALDAKTGDKRWEFWTWNKATGAPVVTPDTVYVGSDDTMIYALDTETGERRWEFSTAGQIDGAGGAVVDGRLYISTFQGGLYALEEQ